MTTPPTGVSFTEGPSSLNPPSYSTTISHAPEGTSMAFTELADELIKYEKLHEDCEERYSELETQFNEKVEIIDALIEAIESLPPSPVNDGVLDLLRR